MQVFITSGYLQIHLHIRAFSRQLKVSVGTDGLQSLKYDFILCHIRQEIAIFEGNKIMNRE